MHNSTRHGDDLLDDPALAAHLRNTLGRVAATTPLDGVEISLAPATDRRRPKPATVLAGALALTGLLGIAAVRVGHDVQPPAEGYAPSGWTPPGTERTVEVTDLKANPTLAAVMNERLGYVVAPGSVRVVSSAETDAVVIFRTAGEGAGDRIGRMRCIADTSGVRACKGTPDDGTIEWMSVPEGDGTTGPAIGINVPAEVAAAVYRSGTDVLWVRPVDGIIQVPQHPADDPTLKFYSAAGIQVPMPQGSDPNLMWIDRLGVEIDGEPVTALGAAFNQALTICLTLNGATSTTGAFDPGRDPNVVWTDCVEQARLEWRSHAVKLGLIPTTAGWAPPGKEIPITIDGPSTKWKYPVDSIVAPGSGRWITVDGVDTALHYASVLDTGDRVFLTNCMWHPRTLEGSCGGSTSSDAVDWMGASDQENRPLWAVSSNIPSNVAVVGFLRAGELAWQRPSDGLVYLPSTDTASASIHLYDADGNEVKQGRDTSSIEQLAIVSLRQRTPDGVEKMSGVFQEALSGCLVSNGADPTTGRFPNDADPTAIWEDCLTVGVTTWQTKVLELGLD